MAWQKRREEKKIVGATVMVKYSREPGNPMKFVKVRVSDLLVHFKEHKRNCIGSQEATYNQG